MDSWEEWSCSYCLPPLGAAKENETEIFEISTLTIESQLEVHVNMIPNGSKSYLENFWLQCELRSNLS